jgi:phage shock protein PspC (stress-responsive transcriptional regulator)
MDETPAGTGHDVERELGGGVAVDEPEPALERAPSPPVRPPLRRRADDKVVAGVAGGLADHWGIPALAVRLPLAIAMFLSAAVVWEVVTGSGSIGPWEGLVGLIVLGSIVATIAYVVLWMVVPREDVVRSPAGRFTQRVSPRRLTRRYPNIGSIPGFVLLAIGGAILADRLGIWEPDLFLAAGLIALGVWLYRRDRSAPSEAAVVERTAEGSETVVVGSAPSTAPAPVIRPPRERSPLGWITFGVALLVVSVAAIWTSLADDTLATAQQAVGLERISTIPAIGLLVLAAGLLVGSVFGRARWLVLPALLAVPVVLVTSVIRLPFEGQFGDANLRPGAPTTPADNEVVMRRNALGSIYVDLGRLRGRGDVVRELELSTAVGTVTVVVPFDAHVRANAFTGLGTITLGSRHTQGVEVSDSATLDPRHGDGATIVVYAEVGLGDVYVLRYAPTRRELRELRREERREERREAAA